jgi:DNA topoisomerase-1
VLQDRSYVKLDKKRFVPEDRGRLVTAFLESFFNRYVEYTFTADLENQLDDISGGRIDWKAVLRAFWTAFSAAIDGTRDLTITQVIDTLDASLGAHFFPAAREGGADPRSCPACSAGRLGLRLSRNGAFIGCSNYPECRYTRPLAVAGANGDEAHEMLEGPRLLGTDTDTGLPVTVRRGPYGSYVQLGPAEAPAAVPVAADAAGASDTSDTTDKTAKTTKTTKTGKPKKKAKKVEDKPKRVSIPKGMPPAELDLDTGLRLLALPREVGRHPESGEPISAGIGRFGPYLRHGNAYKSLADDDDVLTVGLNRAVVLLAETKTRAAGTPGRALGDHPTDGKPITLGSGRFGPYVKHGSLYASLPRGVTPEQVDLEQAIALLEAKAAKAGPAKTPAAKTRAGKATKATKATTPAKAIPQAKAADGKAAAPAEADAATNEPAKPVRKARPKPAAKPAAKTTAKDAKAKDAANDATPGPTKRRGGKTASS